MEFTFFHFVVSLASLLCLILSCILILFVIKNKTQAYILCTVALLIVTIVMYSLFLIIEEYTKQASLSLLSYSRNLRTESLIISGRITNETNFIINKCYLDLSIVDKRGSDSTIFDTKNAKKSTGEKNSVTYRIEIVRDLEGNTYKHFSASVPMPPQFINPEFYHTLECT